MADIRRMRRVVGAVALALGTTVAGAGGLLSTDAVAGATATSSHAGSAQSAVVGARPAGVYGRAPGSLTRPAWHQRTLHPPLWVTAANGKDTTTPGVPNDCLVETAPCKSLGRAIGEAPDGSTIELAPGIYKEYTNPGHSPTVVPSSLQTITISAEGLLTTPTTSPALTTVITAAGFTYGITVNTSDVAIVDVSIEHARRSGLYAFPSTGATSAESLSSIFIAGDHVVHDDTCATTASVMAKTSAECATATPESDFGEGIHLQSVSDSVVETNLVADNWGGILVTDENGPSATDTIVGNTSITNAGDCGITLAGHNATAVHTTGPTAGKPDPASAGVYHVTVETNESSDNGAAGIMDAGGAPGTGVYDNLFVGNEAVGNGLAGFSIHSHAPLQDMNTNVVEDNRFVHNAIHGGPDGGAGDVEGPPASADMMQGAGIEVLGAVTPVHGTRITGNVVATDFYGIWMSPGVQSASAISGNTISVDTGGTALFSEPAPDTGYWMAGSDGGVFSFGTLEYHGSIPGDGHPAPAPVVGIAATDDGGGYWEVAADGAVYAFGDAVSYGTLLVDGAGVSDIVGIATTPDGGGYWLAGADGAVYAFGDATGYGTLPADHVAVSNVVGIADTATGKGYWLVGSDGGVFAFGDASYQGSVPGVGITIDDVKGISPAPGGQGYLLVGADGGVFAFGSVDYYGSLPGDHVSVDNVVGIEGAPTGKGYWMVGSDGGVFAFGTATYHGSVPGVHVSVDNVVAITSNPI